MATHIKPIDDRTIHVNDKPVLKDADGTWKGIVELTQQEARDLSLHLVKLEDHDAR